MTAPEPIDLPADAANWAAHMRACTDQIKQLEEMRDNARRQLETLLGDHEHGAVNGRPLVHWTHVKSIRLDATALKKAQPDLWATYARTTTTRRFVLADPEDEQ